MESVIADFEDGEILDSLDEGPCIRAHVGQMSASKYKFKNESK